MPQNERRRQRPAPNDIKTVAKKATGRQVNSCGCRAALGKGWVDSREDLPRSLDTSPFCWWAAACTATSTPATPKRRLRRTMCSRSAEPRAPQRTQRRCDVGCSSRVSSAKEKCLASKFPRASQDECGELVAKSTGSGGAVVGIQAILAVG